MSIDAGAVNCCEVTPFKSRFVNQESVIASAAFTSMGPIPPSLCARVTDFMYRKSLSISEQRTKMPGCIRDVDLILMESGWEQKLSDVKKQTGNIVAMGSEWGRDVVFVKCVQRIPP
jgi:hypothetical protein